MDAVRWQRVESLFEAALALPAGQREDWLAKSCGADQILLAELRSLLAAHTQSATPLDALPRPAQACRLGPDRLPSGTRMGVWQIGTLIGRGGSGDVYEARRADGLFEQRAAIKLLQREAVQDLERFQRERQILARLEHAGIARLLDGGVSETGRPYAVVEFVEGLPITQHCSQYGLDLSARLALFLQVCEAVAFAHRNLVVHRDLKPGNILVTAEGRVKLLDFGVAKQLGGSQDEETRAPLTPDYAAPEQLTGQAVTTATDVFALGVLLFELLSGERPWRSQGLPLALAVQMIVSEEAPLASRSASAAAQAPLAPQALQGDLDAITAKCLRKDVNARYPTVDALMDDIHRHRAHKPVLARGGARRYVWGRLLYRHRWGVAAGGLVFAALALGLIGMGWQAQRLTVERDLARRAAAREETVRDYMTRMFRSSIAEHKGENAGSAAATPLSARTMLDRSAHRVINAYGDDPKMAGQLVATLSDLYVALEDTEGEVPLLEGFLNAADRRADPEIVALAQQRLAQAELIRGNLDRAAGLLPKAEAFWASAPELYTTQHLEALDVRGTLQRMQGDFAAALRTYQTAVAEQQALSGDATRELAIAYNSMATVLVASNQLEEALAAFRRSLTILEHIGQAEDLEAQIIRANTGTLAYKTGHLSEASQTLQRAIDKERELAGDSTAVASALGVYGAALSARGELRAALPILRQALALSNRFTGVASPLSAMNEMLLTESLGNAAEFKEARQHAEETLRRARSSAGEHSFLALRAELVRAQLWLKEGENQPARASLKALVEALRGLGPRAQIQLAQAQLGLGEALLALGHAEEARAPLREALQIRAALMWSQSWELAQARERLGEALKSSSNASDRQQAKALLVQAESRLSEQLGSAHEQTRRARAALAGIS